MESRHSLLRCQILQVFGGEDRIPDRVNELLNLVDATYLEFESHQTAFLRQVIDLNPHFIFAKDRDGRFTLVNKAVADAYGTSVDELLGKSDADFNPNAEEVEHFRRDDLTVIDGGMEKNIPREMITDATGNVRWLWTIKRPIPSPDGRETHVLGVATDITLQLQAEQNLEERNAMILRNQDAIHQLALMDHSDMETMLETIVLTAARVIGCQRVSVWVYDEMKTGLTCRCLNTGGVITKPATVLHRDDYPRYFSALRESRSVAATDARTDPRTNEFTDGYLIPLGITSMLDVPIWLNGDIIGVVCNGHSGPKREWVPEEVFFASSIADFVSLAVATARRQQLESELRQSQKMEAIGHLAGGVAHDFNNLLTAINGEAQLLLRSPDLPDKALERARQILNAGERAANLTRQLLMFSRKQVTAPRVVDLNEIIRDFAPMLIRVIGEDITLRIVPAVDPAFIKIDPGQIEQVLMNLIVNSRDAMPGGGTISIETRRLRGDAVSAAPDRVGLTVSDTGVGMSEETRVRAFEPFFTTKEAGKGTGLGLSTVYGIIQQNHGRIEVISANDRGTTFTITLPAEAASVSFGCPAAEEEVSRGRETILVVEDEPQVLSLVHEVLEMQGYSILVANGPDQAIQLSGDFKDRIHLMLTDVVMPGMNGIDLYEHLSGSRPDMGVLYMSGYTEGLLDRHGRLDPVTDLVHKPFTFEELNNRVRAALDRSVKGGAGVDRNAA